MTERPPTTREEMARALDVTDPDELAESLRDWLAINREEQELVEQAITPRELRLARLRRQERLFETVLDALTQEEEEE